MEGKVVLTTTDIKIEIDNRQQRLEAQIDHLDNLVTDLISHKLSIENANRQIEQLAKVETDVAKKRRYYDVLRINIELLTKIFNAIAELESIKHRYHKEINDITIDKIKMIAIDIRKIEESLKDSGGDLAVFFEKLSNALSNVGRLDVSTAKSDLNDNPEYKL